MNKTMLAAATALSMISVPAMADHHEGDEMDMTADQQMMYDELDADQRAMFDTYSPDQQTMYFGWNDALRGYYWSLDEDQQEAWWYLDDDQRTTLFQIQAPEQRTAAWNSILTQVAQIEGEATGQTAGAATNASATSNSNMRFASNAVVQDIPAPHQGEYPVCESDADDNCINAWAAGRRGPGVERPLDYWPGQPASSM
ncbi:hypothetical protein [Aurantiacibacter poecillastricola]|uniref:hypothetical protein n=1 Tax=Aurantiacibacter poecillastricola TaxID=3064385 RepID=UPI00273E68F0|nr:hypothetical protein [Aurantiacibacter sp. 219JJ12-13]MDP5261729.1 hypothetical protein [Aurantiacibacter sp. 219JJ12-13]